MNHFLQQEQQMTIHVISLTWQVMFMNGQQRRPAFPAFRVSLGEAITTAATVTRAIATTTALPAATATPVFVHFYICRTGRSSRNLII